MRKSQIELAKSILESHGYTVRESLITQFLPEDLLRSEFSKHNLEILGFDQGNLVKVKTSYGTTLTYKIIRNDDGEYEVLNPNYKTEFIIKD